MNTNIDIKKIRSSRNQALLGKSEETTAEKGVWNFLNKDITLWGGGLTDRIREEFYIELWSLIGAGIDMRTALELVRDEQKKKNAKKVFTGIAQEVVSGATLSAAMQKTREFSNYEYHSIRIGEETGKLLQVLKELSLFFQKKIKQRRQVIGALTYPVVVMVIAFAAVFFMISYVVPMFSDTFKRFGNDLPGITKAVITFSAFLKKFSGLFFLLVSGLVAVALWQRKKLWFRKMSAKLLLRIPVIGSIIKKVYLARFAGTMALLTGSRIPMLQAIQLTRKMITFYPIESSLTDVEEKIMSGAPLYKSLAAHDIYPHKMVSVIKVAEEVNQVDLFFSRLADQYSNEVEYQSGILSKFLEPLIIVVLGVIVGVILIAMYLPLFKLGQTF